VTFFEQELLDQMLKPESITWTSAVLHNYGWLVGWDLMALSALVAILCHKKNDNLVEWLILVKVNIITLWKKQ